MSTEEKILWENIFNKEPVDALTPGITMPMIRYIRERSSARITEEVLMDVRFALGCAEGEDVIERARLLAGVKVLCDEAEGEEK